MLLQNQTRMSTAAKASSLQQAASLHYAQPDAVECKAVHVQETNINYPLAVMKVRADQDPVGSNTGPNKKMSSPKHSTVPERSLSRVLVESSSV